MEEKKLTSMDIVAYSILNILACSETQIVTTVRNGIIEILEKRIKDEASKSTSDE